MAGVIHADPLHLAELKHCGTQLPAGHGAQGQPLEFGAQILQPLGMGRSRMRSRQLRARSMGSGRCSRTPRSISSLACSCLLR